MTSYLESQWAALGSKYALEVKMVHGGPAWVSRTDHPNYVAASRAVTKVFGKPPDLTREGGSIPVANWLADATGMNVLLLPTSASNDGAHAQNEKWDKVNVTNAVKTRCPSTFDPASMASRRDATLPTPSPRHARIAQVKVLGTYLHEISKLVGPRPALCKCAPPTAEDLAKPGFFAFAKGFRCKCEL